MTDNEYAAFRTSLEDVFIPLYAIDAGSLTPEQRKVHQATLSAAYLAVVQAENASLTQLTKSATKKLDDLSASVKALQGQLAGLKKAAEVLNILSGALNVFTSITKLLK